MEAIEITEVKKFMAKLLLHQDFDHFLLSEAEITTFNTFHIDGHIQKKFYQTEEYEALGKPQMSSWSQIRPLCFEMIKGQKTPLRFKIVLKLPEKQVADFLEKQQLSYQPGDVGGLYLNLSYENGTLYCISGVSMQLFTMDKTLERAWDAFVKKKTDDLLALI